MQNRPCRYLCALLLTMVAGSCQTIRNGELPAVLSAPQTPGSILFQDDFSDPSSGWERYRDPSGITDYEGGVYRFRVERPEWYLWSSPGLEFTDVRIEVVAMQAAGQPLNAFGVICRSVDQDNFYYLTVTNDGYFSVAKFKNGVQMLIGMDELLPSPSINQDGAPNHLRVECSGSALSLAVNGVVLAAVEDADFASGDVGLIVGTIAAGGAEIDFDNFAVLVP